MSLALNVSEDASITTISSRSHATVASSVVVAACLVAGIAPLAWQFARELIERGEYTLFLMVPAAVNVLASRPIGRLDRGSWWLAGLLLAAAWACLAVGALIYLRWSAAPAAALMMAGVAYRLGGSALLRWITPAFLLLMVATPLPSAFANPLLLWLRKIAVFGSGHVFDVLGLPNARTGTVIEVPGRRLLVEEACSGINSLTAIIAFSLLYAFLNRKSAGRAAAVAVAAAGFALIANVVRIVAVGVGWVGFGIDLLEPGIHGWLGLLTFALAVGLAVSADRAFALLTPARRRVEVATPIEPTVRPLGSIGYVWAGVAVAFLAVGLWSGTRLSGGWPGSTLPGDAVFLPPKAVGTWTLVTGNNSAPRDIQSVNVQNYSWTFRDGPRRAEVSFTYPFAHGVHDCTICYAVGGWSIDGRTIDPAARRTSVDLSRPGPTLGRLLFATFDERGDWQPPDPPPDTGRWLRDRIAFERDVAGRTPSYEVQVLGIADESIDGPTRDALLALFTSVRDDLRGQMLARRLGATEATR